MKKEINENNFDEIGKNFMWSLITLICSFVGVTICGIISMIYRFCH
jgi:hypothetical protein